MTVMTMIRWISILAVCICQVFSGECINLSKVEFSYLYKDSPVNMRYKIAQRDGTYRLLVYLELKRITEADEVKNFNVVSQKKFTSGRETNLDFLTHDVSNEDGVEIHDMTFQVDPEHSFLVVKLSFLSDPYVFDIPIGRASAFPPADFVLKEPFANQRSVKMSDSVSFEHVGRGGSKYFGYLYKDHFSPASPPFSDEVPDANKRFVIEQIDAANYGYKVPKEHHLYYFQSDTTSKEGVAFYSHKEYYPNVKTVEELISPLIYIATEKEYKKLVEARNKKPSFDEFWLSLIPSQKLAARTIRNYYRRVNRANDMFTNYKEGWKTDMGMIYILYGAPDTVYKKEDSEMWEYEDFSGRIRFEFIKVPNLFTQFHYSLERSKGYTNDWFSQVEKWRKGDS